MSFLLTLALPFMVNGASITHKLQARQFDLMGLSNSMVPPLNPASVVQLTSEYDQGSIHERMTWGPFKIQPANGTHQGGAYLKLDPFSDMISTRVNGICKECVVLAVSADITDKSGKKIELGSGVYSHHIISADFGRKMVAPPVYSVCPDGKMGGFHFESFAGMNGKPMSGLPGMSGGMSHGANGGGGKTHMKRQDLGSTIGSFLGGSSTAVDVVKELANLLLPPFSFFFAQGEDGTQTKFAVKGSKFNSGFYMGRSDKINIMAEAINYQNVAKDVYLMLDYEYIPNVKQLPKDFHDVGIGAITVEPCASASLHPPNDKAALYESPVYKVDGDGYIMDVKAHLHDGALNMTFVVNGKEQCNIDAIYGGGADSGLSLNPLESWETITSYTACADPIRVQKGDNLTMKAYYDVTKHRLRPLSSNPGKPESAEGMALAIFMFAKPPGV